MTCAPFFTQKQYRRVCIHQCNNDISCWMQLLSSIPREKQPERTIINRHTFWIHSCSMSYTAGREPYTAHGTATVMHRKKATWTVDYPFPPVVVQSITGRSILSSNRVVTSRIQFHLHLVSQLDRHFIDIRNAIPCPQCMKIEEWTELPEKRSNLLHMSNGRHNPTIPSNPFSLKALQRTTRRLLKHKEIRRIRNASWFSTGVVNT